MNEDPIIEEVWKLRDALAKSHGYDVKTLFSALQISERQHQRATVAYSPRDPRVVETAAQRAVAADDDSRRG